MKKLYYSIGEVSVMTGIKPHVLRYWETIFDSLRPAKNRAGNRVYTEKNIQTVQELKKLIHDQKYSTAGAKKALKAQKNMTSDGKAGFAAPQRLSPDMQNDLSRVRDFLGDLLKEI